MEVMRDSITEKQKKKKKRLEFIDPYIELEMWSTGTYRAISILTYYLLLTDLTMIKYIVILSLENSCSYLIICMKIIKIGLHSRRR